MWDRDDTTVGESLDDENKYCQTISSWAPTQASLKFTILDELEQWVLRNDGYDVNNELPSLISTECKSLEDNSPSPRPLDILSLLMRIQDNASMWYDTTNHHPNLTLLFKQVHIQVLIKQVQSAINTLHNLQWLVSPPLPPIPISHNLEEHHRSSYFAARARELYEYKSPSDNSSYSETLHNFHLD
ncbi:hypothetical protein BD311DRAFT_783018 [Dichomitus squalens]|uniref:Uncharacterized protein n=1 Tax=Dichomitus squalens TaxID=114155 RepID=A0A4Q9M380_9APHY|nr:hypothetical protein BD311DRAFT_783044 [Dichomitus squalens]TBU21249.1 hypothetical protein BD311DRAFT_783018 [Dichomitus squalens]